MPEARPPNQSRLPVASHFLGCLLAGGRQCIVAASVFRENRWLSTGPRAMVSDQTERSFSMLGERERGIPPRFPPKLLVL